MKQWYIATLKFAERTNEIMDATIGADYNKYYNLSELAEALNQQHGTMISRSTLSRMVTKGLLRPDLTTSKEVLFLKSRLPEIAEAINNMRQTKNQEYQEIVKEEQQPPPQLEPIVITQAQEQPQPLGTAKLNVIEEIIAEIYSLKTQLKNQQEEIQQLKTTVKELENELNNKIKDLAKEETNDYNKLADVITNNANAFNKHLNESEKQFEKLRIKLETLEKRIGDNELHELEKEIARSLYNYY
jgi:DNA repair exonuclease SbcCD ATPase subunit